MFKMAIVTKQVRSTTLTSATPPAVLRLLLDSDGEQILDDAGDTIADSDG